MKSRNFGRHFEKKSSDFNDPKVNKIELMKNKLFSITDLCNAWKNVQLNWKTMNFLEVKMADEIFQVSLFEFRPIFKLTWSSWIFK